MKRILTAFLLVLCVLCIAPGIYGAQSNTPGVYYQHFANSPHPDYEGECLVVQWYQMNHLGDDAHQFSVEAIIFEDGRILLQYGPGDPEQGLGTTVGIQTTGGQAEQYYCEGYGGGFESASQEKSYDPPAGLAGMSAGPIPGNMALLFTPNEMEPLQPFVSPAIAPWSYTLTSASYNMVDIYNSGTNINIYGDDSYAGSFNIGFDFPFYGTSYDHFYASTNCLISFNGGSNIFYNSCLPTNTPDLDMIAVFWDDMWIPGEDSNVTDVEDAYTKYKQYTKSKNDEKFLGIACFITAAAGGTNILFPLLIAAACTAGRFLSRKKTSK